MVADAVNDDVHAVTATTIGDDVHDVAHLLSSYQLQLLLLLVMVFG